MLTLLIPNSRQTGWWLAVPSGNRWRAGNRSRGRLAFLAGSD